MLLEDRKLMMNINLRIVEGGFGDIVTALQFTAGTKRGPE